MFVEAIGQERKTFFSYLRDEIDQFSSHVPKSPIRELLELEPETAKFGKPEKLADGRRVRVSVEVFGKGTFKVFHKLITEISYQHLHRVLDETTGLLSVLLQNAH